MPTTGANLNTTPSNEKFHYPPLVKNFLNYLRSSAQLIIQFADIVANAIVGCQMFRTPMN
jgi:hypothetical protein